MITIARKYHFYAAHRNETLNDKCRNIHGHTYYVTVYLTFSEPDKKTGVTMLFGEIDKMIEPIIKTMDHSFLINENDPLVKYLRMFQDSERCSLKLFYCKDVTSVENLAKWIWEEIKNLYIPNALNLIVEVQETQSATVLYEPK